MSDVHDDGKRDIHQLIGIMAALRDPDAGCPWDVAQTFATIAPYTIEEAYEVADAIDRGDLADLKDELGDLLLQVAFHARMAQEQGAFDFGDVVAAICDKMTRRHPHVFDAHGRANAAGGRMPGAAGDEARKDNADSQLQHWEALKRAEREARGDADPSALAGIARGLPEWQRAVKLQHKAAKVGFDWPDPAPVLEKLHEEIEEVRAEFAAVAADPGDAAAHDRLEDEIGDILFVCANLARHAKVDFGAALRRANHKFERRFRAMEALAAADGGLAGQSLQAQDRYWTRAKQAEKEAQQ
ncbi:MAG: nucleoside triphosphate pyrophosphohydrolase [Lysobacteraceae bacterium]|nr:MAG: nucleoside triphosphate pyrophosphohydrolase [Xanthomonadaceae bacterium]